jgi:hypothetical protein
MNRRHDPAAVGAHNVEELAEPTANPEPKKYTYYRSTFYFTGKQYSATSAKPYTTPRQIL